MAFGFHIAEPNEALLISGRKGEKIPEAEESMRFKIVTGDRVFVWPILQSVRSLSLDLHRAQVPVECYTTQGIPVLIEGVVAFKVGADFPSIANAAQRFLEDPGSMEQRVHELFAGHVRAIVGGMTVESLIRERETLTHTARETTGEDMIKMGLIIDSLQIARIEDPTGYIEKMAQPQLAQVARLARIAEAENNREASEREAEQAALVAEAQRASEIKQAEAKAEVDRVNAQSAQAGPLARAEAEKAVVQKQTEVAELAAARRERELETEIRKPADARAYATAKDAEGQRDARIRAAEAQAAETEKVGAAEAAATELRGTAEANVIKSKGDAEGAALKARAEGLEANQEAVISQAIAEKLPEIVQAATHIYDNVDQVTILDGSDGMQRSLQTLINMGGEAFKTARAQFAATDEHRESMQEKVEKRTEEPVIEPGM